MQTCANTVLDYIIYLFNLRFFLLRVSTRSAFIRKESECGRWLYRVAKQTLVIVAPCYMYAADAAFQTGLDRNSNHVRRLKKVAFIISATNDMTGCVNFNNS